MEYQLERVQTLPASLDEVFAFFADAGNLARITPPWLHFAIHTALPIEMREGAQLEYTIRLAGLPLSWRTRIVAWDPPREFVDYQERGPYSLWEHRHRFEEVPSGVRMRDEVRYRLPFGPVGTLAHRVVVRRLLEEIFDYRRESIAALFPPGRVSGSPSGVGRATDGGHRPTPKEKSDE